MPGAFQLAPCPPVWVPDKMQMQIFSELKARGAFESGDFEHLNAVREIQCSFEQEVQNTYGL